MSNYFHCDLCDISVNIKSKNRHLNSQSHRSLTNKIIHKSNIKNPNFLQIENILQEHVDDYNKKFEFYLIYCKWKLHFSDTIIDIKSDRLHNTFPPRWNLRRLLLSKIERLESNECIFSHISDMEIVFITHWRNATYEHYLKIPKTMLEWTMIKKLANNPNLIKAFNINTYHPLIRIYGYIIRDGDLLYRI